MLSKEQFKKIKKEAKLELKRLEEEYAHLRHTAEPPLPERQDDWTNEELREMARRRLHRRYASITIECCTIVEHMLHELYQQSYQQPFNSVQLMKTPAYRSRSNIEILQAELKKQHISPVPKQESEQPDQAIVQVFQLRNKLMLEHFEFAAVMKDHHDASRTLAWILDTMKAYRKQLKYRPA